MKFLRLLLLALMLNLQPALAMPAFLNVDLFQSHPAVSHISLTGPIYIGSQTKQYLPAGKYTVGVEEREIVVTPAQSSSTLCRAQAITISGYQNNPVAVTYSQAIARRYQGLLKFTVGPMSTLHIRNVVGAKDYVSSVVGSETWPNWPTEALKAQAVLTQTRLARLSDKAVLSDSTQEEAYFGADYAKGYVKDAVQSVWGQALTFKHRPIVPFYHAACGGATSSGANIFGTNGADTNYLESVKCSFCKSSPFWQTKSSVLPAGILEKTAANLQKTEILKQDAAGRPIKVKLANGAIISGYQFWLQLGQNFGWDKAPGTRYKLCKQIDNSLKISSNGAGHGVGMCQWGAASQARMGKSYKDVLHYYFPATTIEQYF